MRGRGGFLSPCTTARSSVLETSHRPGTRRALAIAPLLARLLALPLGVVSFTTPLVGDGLLGVVFAISLLLVFDFWNVDEELPLGLPCFAPPRFCLTLPRTSTRFSFFTVLIVTFITVPWSSFNCRIHFSVPWA